MSEEINVDELMEQIEAPSEGFPMTGEPVAPATTQAAPTWNGQEWEFESRGRKVAPDSRDTALQWMAKGHDYTRVVGEWNQKERDYQRQIQERDQKYGRFKEVDEYVQKDPEWWKFVEQQWQNRETRQLDPSLQPVIGPLMEKIGSLESFVQSQQQQAAIQEQERQDSKLNEEIESTRKSHPTIDLNAIDDSGQTLEYRVLAHAQQIGTNSFRAAFRDYLHDQLVELSKSKALETTAKETAVRAKRGLLGTTPTPTKQITQLQNSRSKSWEDVGREALAELGINQ